MNMNIIILHCMRELASPSIHAPAGFTIMPPHLDNTPPPSTLLHLFILLVLSLQQHHSLVHVGHGEEVDQGRVRQSECLALCPLGRLPGETGRGRRCSQRHAICHHNP